jgi:hypothetical protein
MAGGEGVEPPLTDSKSAVLPLHQPPMVDTVGVEPNLSHCKRDAFPLCY